MAHTAEQIKEIEQIAVRYREQSVLEELRSKKTKIEIYFDTYQILPIIQGYWELQKNIFNNIDVSIFKNDRFLIKSLVYFGYIRNVKILLPHAAELKNQLDKTYLFPAENISKEKINRFLLDIELDGIEQLKSIFESNGMEAYLIKLAPHTENIFKANYVLEELIWTRRYNHLFDSNGIIQYDNFKYNAAEILESRLFHKILNALAESTVTRRHKTVNNLRDAMALCMFHQKVRQFKKNQDVLPLFYVSGGVLSKLRENLQNEFRVVYKGHQINLLKDTEFFIVDAMFSENTPAAEDKVFKKMRQIKESLKVYTEIGESFPQYDINSLIADWKQFRNNDFFEKIWPGEGGRKSLSKNIVGLLEYDILVKNEETFKKIIEREKEKICKSLDERVNDLVFLEDIWKEVESFNEILSYRINHDSVNSYELSDVFRDEGLTRFSPPTGYIEKEIKEFWHGFLESHQKNNDEAYRLLKVKLTKLIYDGFLKETKRDFDKILVGLSVLWVFHKYQLIIRLINRLNMEYGKYYQIVLIYLASMIRLGWKTASQLKNMEKHINCIETKEWFKSNYKAWLGIGFIKFNIWKMHQSDTPDFRASDKKFENYLADGIVLTQKAYHYLAKWKDLDDDKSIYRNVKYYYSLNNYIYYSLHNDISESNITDFHSYVDELMNVQSENLYSQCRFSDTIAYYYYYRAKKARLKADKLNYLKSAEGYSSNAISTSVFIDDRFASLREKIKVYKQELEST